MKSQSILVYQRLYLVESVDVPIAMGENLHIFSEFHNAFNIEISHTSGFDDLIGGITGWLNVAKLAKSSVNSFTTWDARARALV